MRACMIHLWPRTQAGAGFLPFTESFFPFVTNLYNARRRFEVVVGGCVGLGWVGFGPVALGWVVRCVVWMVVLEGFCGLALAWLGWLVG